jgi:hypothetical protein
MTGHTPTISHIQKLSLLNGTPWLVDIELLATMHRQFAGILLYRGATRMPGWLNRAVKRSIAFDEPSRAPARPALSIADEDYSESFLQVVDDIALAHQEGAGDIGGAEPTLARERPQRGKAEDGEQGSDSATSGTVTRAVAAREAALRDTDVDAEFMALVMKIAKTDRKRAGELLLAGQTQTPTPTKKEDTLADRKAQLCALMKSCISAPLLPRFMAFDSPQDIYDEVAGWELDKRANSLPLLREKLTGLIMQGSESPADFFTRSKLIFVDLDVCGEVHTEFSAVTQILNAVVHDRFFALKTFYSGVVPSELLFDEVLSRFNRVEMSCMSLPHNHSHYPPYLRPSKSPAPAYAAHVFTPAGGRGTGAAQATGGRGGRGGGGGGRAGRGTGGAAGGGRGSLKCAHCGLSGHLIATCYKLHPHLAPSSSRPKPAEHAPSQAEYAALLAQLARYQGH